LVLADERRLRFGHPLVRSATYQGALLSDRIAAHRALAAVLTGAGEEDRQSCHLAAAVVGPDEDAAAALEGAADRAMARRGPGVAVGLLERSAELSPDGSGRARRLARAASAAIRVGQHDRARTFMEHAAKLTTDVETRTELCLSRAQLEDETVGADTAVATLMQAADLAGADPATAAQCLATAGRIAWTAHDRPLAGAVHQRLLALTADHSPPAPSPDRLTRDAAGPTEWTAHLTSLWDRPSSFGPSPWAWPPALAAYIAGHELAGYRLYRRGTSELRAAGAMADLALVLDRDRSRSLA
jgi:hypothetical protein